MVSSIEETLKSVITVVIGGDGPRRRIHFGHVSKQGGNARVQGNPVDGDAEDVAKAEEQV